MKNALNTLFLHYGPGGNSEIEKIWLGPTLPNVLFWNQPVIKESSGAFSLLKKACQEQITTFSEKVGGPVHVWAHSFGCNIALSLLMDAQLPIKSLRLYSPILDFPEGFYHLAKTLANDSETPPAAREVLMIALNKFEEASLSEKNSVMWQIVGAIAQDPNFQRKYWFNPQKLRRYLEIAKTVTPPNMTMWQNTLIDYQSQTTNNSVLSELTIPVKAIFGSKDPYLDLDEDTKLLKRLIPTVEVTALAEIGHYCHLEANIQ